MALSHLQISPQLVQAVRDAVDIVGIAAEHTRLTRTGRRFKGLCPLHKEKTPSFSLDAEQGLFYCFGCGAGGDAIKLHMLLSGDDFPAAIESLAQRYGIPIPKVAIVRDREGGSERDLEPVLAAAEEFFAAELGRSSEASGYLERRRIPVELRERFGLGYAPNDWRRLLGALHPRFPLADLEAAGLVARPEGGGEPYDRFRHRLIFPIRNASGRLTGFGGRTLGDDKAKYLNTAETERFHKGSLLYGLDRARRAIRDTRRALLVEGYFDVLAAVAAGVEGTVASMGTALTPEQAQLLARYAEEVVVGYDGDEAGENASRRALAILLAEKLGVRRARFGAGHDPDSLRLSAGERAVAAAIEEASDLVVLELDRLIPADVYRHPRVRARAATAVAELLSPIRDAVLRYSYGRLAADRLGVPAELLWQRLGVGREALKAAAAEPAAHRSEVRSIEERALQQLLDPETPSGSVPAWDSLPPAEAFLDPGCRNIYAAFHALYREGKGEVPGVREVLARLGEARDSLDGFASLMLETGASVAGPRLDETLRELLRRWQKQRQRQLASEISEAERRGDVALRDQLLNEKNHLSHELHARSGSAPATRRD